jgi:hypothetical protein
MAFKKPTKYREALQHIDVIVRFIHPKESVPNPHVIICHNFKYHTTLSSVTVKHFLHNKWIIVLTSMHAVKHTINPLTLSYAMI